MRELQKRKGIRLKGYDYSQNGAYFITICVKNRHQLLGKIVGDAVLSVPSVLLSDIGSCVDEYLKKMDGIQNFLHLDHCVVMPNHVHLLISINGGTQRTASPTKAAIPSVVHGMKAFVTKRFGFSVFQRSYHDHIIRNESEYKKIWHYIDANPQQWENDCFFVPSA